MAIERTNTFTRNGTAATRSGTIVVSAASLRKELVKPDMANAVYPRWVEDGEEAAKSVYLTITSLFPDALSKSREGEWLLAGYGRGGKTYLTAPGKMLRSMAKSALLSAYFENNSAASAWQRYADAQLKANDERSADLMAVDGADTREGEGGNDLDRAADIAMRAVSVAAAWVSFAASLAEMVSRLGDGEIIDTSYTPRADEAEPKSVTPRAAATLARFLEAEQKKREAPPALSAEEQKAADDAAWLAANDQKAADEKKSAKTKKAD